MRELENVVERAVTLVRGAGDQPRRLRAAACPTGPQPAAGVLPDEGLDLERHLAELELGLLRQALERTGGNRTKAAALLGMSFRQFRYRLAKHDPASATDEASEEPRDE